MGVGDSNPRKPGSKLRYSKQETTQISGGDLDGQASYTDEKLGVKTDHNPAQFATIREMEAVHGSTSVNAEHIDNQGNQGQSNRANMETSNTRDTMLHKKADDKTYVTNISDPNQLFAYASYNTIFTLSVLNTDELKNTKTLLSSSPHDIIIRSGGIGPNNPSFGEGMTAENKAILQANKRMGQTNKNAQREFVKNNDMYFKSVVMNNIPGLNEKRRLTSVTQVNMEIVEPWGISLLERLKAGAANNNFLDHLDAPYMLTVEFIGWDELGKPISSDVTKTTKRVIPIKLTNMSMDVNQSGTVYQVQGIPYNEFAYVDRYNYPRTSGTIEPKGKKMNFVVQALEDILNRQTSEEMRDGLVEKPDKYFITIDKFFKPDSTPIVNKAINQATMYINKHTEKKVWTPGAKTASDVTESTAGQTYVNQKKMESGAGVKSQYTNAEKLEYMKIDSSNSIIKILEEIMKSHPDMTDDKYKSWQEKVKKSLTYSKDKGADVDQRAKGKDMYYDYFRIRSSIVPTKVYDNKRKRNVKEIYFVVEPYEVHAYSLAIPGISTGQNMKHFVYKTYNYLFTGENVDILNVDIKYKVAYFTAVLKDVAGDTGKANKIEEKTEDTGDKGTTADDESGDGPFHSSSEPSVSKSAGTGSTDTKNTQLDQFMDYLTHPTADMVTIKLTILGDPAWLGVSQFIPAVPFKIKEGMSADKDIAYWRGNKDAIWNDKYHCYNPDLAEPIVMLNFRMPTDVNDKMGTYEISKEQQATFSGLYRVTQVEHNWDGGEYSNVLQLVRFNNQGVNISDPQKIVAYTTPDGSKMIGTAAEADKMMGGDRFSFLGMKGFSFADIREKARSNIFRKVDKLTKSFHPSQGNVAKNFHPSQGNVANQFHPSQGGSINASQLEQTAVNRGVRANEDDI